MKFGELFAGFGGIGLGLEQAGMVCRWQVESDPFCQKVLTKHWPNVPKFNDVREVGKHNLESVDLICGGFPCQPYSVCGKGLGASDDRFLWPEMLRVVSELNPEWVVGENVSGIAANGGVELERVCGSLEAQGYEVFPPIDLPACAFGLQTVERHTWIIATTTSKRLQGRKEIPNTNNGNERELPRANQGVDYRWHLPESRVYRSRKGVPYLVERNRGLGNAVPPPMAEWIGRRIQERELIELWKK
jgi:DNA (cytosine-5)-methyltransferase 1